jgi:hypothetical protein
MNSCPCNITSVQCKYSLNINLDRAMAQAVSRRPPTAEARVRSRSVHVGFMVDKVALGQVPPPPEYFDFPLSISFHRCSISWKNEKIIIFLFIFITGLHNKPQGCGASVASAAGPFSTKIYIYKPILYTSLLSLFTTQTLLLLLLLPPPSLLLSSFPP